MSAPLPAIPVAYYRADDLYALDVAARDFGARLGEGALGGALERWRTTGDATTADRLAERVGTAPLFGGGTLVVVAEPGPLVRSTAERDALAGVVRSVAPGNGLVFLESVDGSGRAPAALDRLRDDVAAAGGETREFKAPKEAQLSGWIEARARERGLRLARGAAQALAERVGGFVREGDVDRRRQGQMAVAELDKLALYRPTDEVTPDDVKALVAEAVPGSTWALLDAIAGRRTRLATELLDRLLDTTPEPVLVVVIHRRLRELLEVADRMESGETPGSLVRSMKLKPYRAEKLTDAARAWTPLELEDALEALLDVDVAVKGATGTMVSEAQRRLAFTLWIAEHVRPGPRPGQAAIDATPRPTRPAPA